MRPYTPFIRSISIGVLVLAAPALATEIEIRIGIMDLDRQGLGGRFSVREGNDVNGDPRWSIDNPVTPLNADTNILISSPELHRGSHTSTFIRGDDIGPMIAAFIRFDLLSQGKEVNDPIFDAIFRLGNLIDPAPGSGQVDIYGLLPGHPNERWVETVSMSDEFVMWSESPPWPLKWNNAPAIDRQVNVGEIIPAETFGNGALLGSFTFADGDSAETFYSISGGPDSNLVNFLNAARTEGDHLATFILVPGTSETALLRPRAKEAGGTAASKAELIVIVPEPAAMSLLVLAGAGLLGRWRARGDMGWQSEPGAPDLKVEPLPGSGFQRPAAHLRKTSEFLRKIPPLLVKYLW